MNGLSNLLILCFLRILAQFLWRESVTDKQNNIVSIGIGIPAYLLISKINAKNMDKSPLAFLMSC